MLRPRTHGANRRPGAQLKRNMEAAGAGAKARPAASGAKVSSRQRGVRRRTLLVALLALSIVFASRYWQATAPGWQQLEVLGTVLRFNLRGQRPLSDMIRIVGI